LAFKFLWISNLAESKEDKTKLNLLVSISLAKLFVLKEMSSNQSSAIALLSPNLCLTNREKSDEEKQK
jgi:hypothetical protein